jgi:hypothetical protein
MIAPQKYGDRVTLTGDADNPIAVTQVDPEARLTRFLEFIQRSHDNQPKLVDAKSPGMSDEQWNDYVKTIAETPAPKAK